MYGNPRRLARVAAGRMSRPIPRARKFRPYEERILISVIRPIRVISDKTSPVIGPMHP
jgi:hypothetical protein